MREANVIPIKARVADVPHLVSGPALYSGLGSTPGTESLLKEANRGWNAIGIQQIAMRASALWPTIKSIRNGVETVIDESHPLYRLMDKPHPLYTRGQLFWLIAYWFKAVGDAYLFKQRDLLGTVVVLHPISPTRVAIEQRGMELVYRVYDTKGQSQIVALSEMVRIWRPDPEQIFAARGDLAPQAVISDAARFIAEHLRCQYESDNTPRFMLIPGEGTDPGKIGGPDQMRWITWFRKLFDRRAGKFKGGPGIAPKGYTVHEFGANQNGLALADVLKHFARNLLSAFGVPESKAGLTENVNRASAEAADYTFNKETIEPLAQWIADALTDQLAREFDPSLFVTFAGIVPADKEFELKRQAQDLATKVKSPNQILEERGEDPSEWGEYPIGSFTDVPYTGEAQETESGEDLVIAEGLVSEEAKPGEIVEKDLVLNGAQVTSLVGIVAQVEEGLLPYSSAMEIIQSAFGMNAEKAKKILGRGDDHCTLQRVATPLQREAWARNSQTDKRLAAKFERATRRVFDLQETRVKSRFTKRTRATGDGDMLGDDAEWSDLFEKNIGPVRKQIAMQAGKNGADLVKSAGGSSGQFVYTDRVASLVKAQGAALVKHANKTTRDALAKTLSEAVENGETISEMEKRINKVFDTRRSNARTIARTETGRTSQSAQVESFHQLGVGKKRWNHSLAAHPREEHLAIDGEVVDLEDEFRLSNGATAPSPNNFGDPEEDCNCRCFVTPVVIE